VLVSDLLSSARSWVPVYADSYSPVVFPGELLFVVILGPPRETIRLLKNLFCKVKSLIETGGPKSNIKGVP